ncbi:ABC transporter [Nitrospira sp. KM1]|uniref:ABC transporter ATP-binding protein n=1 Tax=Nitrospira sp. KM1 TaxID=1936990 RepID=UPI0013A7A5A5|nr:ABC transporter ATP-binding protein [Nitrospira sp. KM1]BCA55532.1 ABC transporter [Nitrospira sp. KM1]
MIAIKAEQLKKKYTISLGKRQNNGAHEHLSERVSDFFRNCLTASSRRMAQQELWSLQDVSFEIKVGEAVGIIGRNGAGKSTLLKILSRITEPTSGRAYIHGRVGVLLEIGTGFHGELTGRDNIYLSGIILGMKKYEIKRRFDEIVAFSGIEQFIDTPVKRYSSGMYVRLAFAVAAHLETQVLILDEIFAVGDGEFQKKCTAKMEEMGSQGRTVLLVSHNLPLVTRLCQRAILMDQGRILADGQAGEVVSQYLSLHAGASGLREWTDRRIAPGNDAVRLRAVRIRDEQMVVKNVLDTTESFAVELEYEVLRPGLVLAPHFALVNDKSDLVFTAYEPDQTVRRREVGNYVSRGIVPGNLLTEGTYFVNAHCRTLRSREVDIQEYEALVLQIVEGDTEHSARGHIGGPIPGVIRPRLQWTVNFDKFEQ